MKQTRLDSLLVKRGMAKSRQRAKALIEAQQVVVNGKLARKASVMCDPDVDIHMESPDIPWVSRAGLKLEKALRKWSIDVSEAVCLDIGASTGGFTEVLLYNGAQKVYALDVGHGNLDGRLREDPRVVVMEKRNIRDADGSWFSGQFDIITVDISHISLKYAMPKIAEFLSPEGEAVALIKPQFEVGKEHIGKGLVRDPVLHEKAIEAVRMFAEEAGLVSVEVTESPIDGVAGNREFLLHLKRR